MYSHFFPFKAKSKCGQHGCSHWLICILMYPKCKYNSVLWLVLWMIWILLMIFYCLFINSAFFFNSYFFLLLKCNDLHRRDSLSCLAHDDHLIVFSDTVLSCWSAACQRSWERWVSQRNTGEPVAVFTQL